MALRFPTRTDIAAIRFCGHGNTLRWITGMPTDQQSKRRSIRLTKGLFWWSRASRSSLAVRPSIGCAAGVPATNRVPTALPKEIIADSSRSPSPERCLNLASSFQTNRGWASSSSELGSIPNFLASENRNSSRAEAEVSPSSLHHRGQAASMARPLRPSFFSRSLRFLAVSCFLDTAYPHSSRHRCLLAQSVGQVQNKPYPVPCLDLILMHNEN